MKLSSDIETTAKETWHKIFLITDILRNTSFGVLRMKSQFNFAQFPIIQFFFECPDASPAMKDLIAVSGLSSGALSQAVDSLVSSGYVERVRSKTDLRSHLVHATEKLKELRAQSAGHFDQALQAFRQTSGITPEEISIADEILLRLAESRTGGELTVLGQASDLEMPGLSSNGQRKLDRTPVWMLLLHFATNLRMPALMFHYGKRSRTTLNKLRFMNYVLFVRNEGQGTHDQELCAEISFPDWNRLADTGFPERRRNGEVHFQNGKTERYSGPPHETGAPSHGAELGIVHWVHAEFPQRSRA